MFEQRLRRLMRFTKLAWMSVVFVVFPLGCANEDSVISPEIYELHDRGVAKMGQFQYAAAYEDFSLVVERAPQWDEGAVNLAIATLNRQEPDDEQRTLKTLETVLKRSPDNVRALYTSGIVNLYLGQTTEAIGFLSKAASIDPDDAFTTYFLGQAHLQAGNYEAAQEWLLKTLDLNSAIRSAYWAAATASRRLNEIEKANTLIEDYQAFEHNPLSVSAGFSYKQMGPKAEAKSVAADVVRRTDKPTGDLFRHPLRLDVNLGTVQSISSFDLNDDGGWDLLISDETSAHVLVANSNSFMEAAIEGLETAHVASAWGDMTNDGATELVQCNAEGLVVLGKAGASFVTRQSVAEIECRSLRVIDADHDGDLDIVASGKFGTRIFHNDQNGGFKEHEAAESLGANLPVSQTLAADLDRDRDVDLVLIGEDAANRVWRNDLTWRYEPFPGFNELLGDELVAATVLDIEHDGRLELTTATQSGMIEVWRNDRNLWSKTTLQIASTDDVLALDAHDFDGDGRSEIFVAHGKGFKVFDLRSSLELASVELDNLVAALPIYVSPSVGPGVVAANDEGVWYFRPGEGRYPFLAISPTGKSSADQMRSNASGIGTYIKLRADSRWSLGSDFNRHSGPSQSLMPLMFGSGGADQADYIELLWSDGVTQSELALAFGELHRIDEIQRQLASCPVVFVWDGEKYEFLSDVLGVATLGYFATPGETTPVRSFERLLVPQGFMKPRNGKFEVKIGEPMEEVLYLDAADLLYFDVPDAWSMVLDERLNVLSREPTGEPIFFQHVLSPTHAATNKHEDVTSALADADLSAPDPGQVDPRFIGLVTEEHILTLEFQAELPVRNAVLIAEGWIEYPYSQTSFAAFQADVAYEAPTLEARDGSGIWHVVADQFGYPAGMPRQMVLPLPDLPSGSTALRLRSNLEIYWDRIRVAHQQENSNVRTGSAKLLRAVVKSTGFARRSTGPQRTPYYDYDDRLTYWDAKFAEGFYTAMGDASELVEATDGSVAIIGSGEEVHLEFEVPPPVKSGYRRYYALDFRGWAKDMDMYTVTGDTVEPVPVLGDADLAQRAKQHSLHAKYNVRHQSGMASR